MAWIVTHQPPQIGDLLPAERRPVPVWLSTHAFPFFGYVRWESTGPYWVVYHGNVAIGTDVTHWCDLVFDGPTPAQTQGLQGWGREACQYTGEEEA